MANVSVGVAASDAKINVAEDAGDWNSEEIMSLDEAGKTGLREICQEAKQMCTKVGQAEPAKLMDLVSVAKDIVRTMHENLSLKKDVPR